MHNALGIAWGERVVCYGLFTALSLLGVVLTSSVACGDNSIKVRFLSEAPAAWSQYVAAVSNYELKCQSVSLLSNSSDYATRKETVESEYKWSREYKLDVKKTTSETKYKDKRPPTVESWGRAYCVTPAISYFLRSENGAPWSIQYAGADASQIVGYLELDEVQRRVLCVSTEMASDLVKDPTFVVASAEERDQDGVPAVRITFHHQIPKEKEFGVFGGSIDFAPAWNWVILAYRVRCKENRSDQQGKRTDEMRQHFRPPDSGCPVPLIQSDEFKTTFNDGRPVEYTETTEYTKFELREVPAAEFDMATFGVHTSLASSLSTFWRAVLYAANGIVFLAVAVWLCRRYQKAWRGTAI
ncbi:MAG TPA: hypothetical protein VFE24_12985 [Pirellulales bacterium]|jgi:hypothetical protein|nr:hypothetical protein [Pirellulales bacterium]